MLALGPQAHQAGRRLVGLIAGNPVTLGQMTRNVPAVGSYATGTPVTATAVRRAFENAMTQRMLP